MSINKYMWNLVRALPLIIILAAAGCGGEADESKTTDGGPAKRESTTQKTQKEVIVAEPGDIAAGKIVYDKHCHYCHGRKGRGQGAVAIAVEPNPADFIRDEKRMAVTDEALYKSLSYGITKEDSSTQKLEKALAMPPFMGVLTTKERWDVIAYVRELVRLASSEKSQK
jgi:mono/diheme cytochrome c family protein